jgi:glucose/arabinose dehydrogenase/mono/diheme cytochrome c family protein
MRHFLPALLAVPLLAPASAADEASLARQGLRAEIFAGEPRGNPVAIRVDRDIHFDWRGSPPDLRLPPGPFAIRWTGKLLAPEDGDVRLSVHVAGAVRVAVDGEIALEGERAEPSWIAGKPLRLDHGEHRLEVEYRKTGTHARIGLYWEGESFALEPIGEAHLFAPDGEPPPDDFERGLRLARALRCAACHSIPGLPPPPRAPSLARAADSVGGDYLVRRLLSPREAAPGARMPELSLDSGESEDLAAFLGARAQGTVGTREPATAASIDEGRGLVLTRGCLACHTLGGIGLGTRFGGGALDDAGSHRDPAALGRLLGAGKGPGDTSVHRPEIPWAKGEREKAVAFLAASARRSTQAAAGDASPRAPDRARGRDLARTLRCGACHDLPEDLGPPSPVPPLHAGLSWRLERSCLVRGDGRRPFFPLEDGERRAVETFLRAVVPVATPAAFEEGRLLLDEKGCTSCHARGARSGIAEAAPAIAAAHPDLRGLEGSWRPPPLSGAGDKLPDDVLRKAVQGQLGARRPWLAARMPRYRHATGEEDALVLFLLTRDRVPEGAPSGLAGGERDDPSSLPPAEDLYAAGHVLAGPEGWSCTSCHDMGSHSPGGIAVTARGPDLLRMSERIRRPWFLRWMRDPSRIAPGIEMPGYQTARPGILGGVLDHQLAALWHVFNSESFSLPFHAGAVREVEVAPDGPLRVIRDVFRLDRWIPRAMAVGFPGGQNILYDLSLFAPAAWWTDGLARQLTQGKTWFWEPTGIPVVARIPAVPPIALRREGALLLPRVEEGTVGRLVSWRRVTASRLEIEYDLRFAGEAAVRVTESVEPGAAGAPGITRRFAARGVPGGDEPVLLLALPERTGPTVTGGSVTARSERGLISFPAGARGWRPVERVEGLPEGAAVFERAMEGGAGEARGEVSFAMAAPARSGPAARAPPAPALAPVPPRAAAEQLSIVPGFSAVRLPLDPSVMPTAFAFRADGSAVLTSLKGDLFALADRDGDGIEETLAPIGDLLSAPLGLLTEDGDVLVSHKPELIRLSDTDGDGWLDLARVVASGWGFSHDYHDWTFGIVRSGGGYEVLLGSDYQQGTRPRDASRHRGKALRILPGGEIEEVARGLRFTIGIASDREGEVFFTDNQGEGNPFNELNHLRDGAKYGVPSLLDSPADWKEPAEPPAIQFPHPWTRSVNGICFLDAGGRFGPFEGHGIGCEYDNRMLIRFTLEKVRGRYQGACYPFSRSPAKDEGFLGPISCAASPRGELYVGDIRDSGWGGGRNVGAVVRLRLDGEVPAGIREARAWSGGFVVEFTKPLDSAPASDPSSYSISAYRRVWSGGYATPDQDRHAVAVSEAAVLDGGRAVRLRAAPLQPGFLHEIHVRSPAGETLWPSIAYYTLHEIPAE